MAVSLALLVILSAIGVVYSKYLSRKYFVELQGVEKALDAIDVQWGRLQLEQSTLATHSRVTEIAQERLNMHIPKGDEIRVVRP